MRSIPRHWRPSFGGGEKKAQEAGCTLVGGHTVEAKELIYGLSVTGIVHPEKFVSNELARPGDWIVLTKPLGTGIITTAKKLNLLGDREEWLETALEAMTTLNRTAAEVMVARGVLAATDVTGFGLVGHATELARASNVFIEIDSALVPFLPGAVELAGASVLTGGDGKNRLFTRDVVEIDSNLDQGVNRVLYDPQTSGGLLLCVAADQRDSLMSDLVDRGLKGVSVIGRVLPPRPPILVRIV